MIIHQTYNQLFPISETALAREAAHKRSLGYHDIRIGTKPDDRLLAFIAKNLPRLLVSSRAPFDESKDLLAAYGSGEIPYPAFAEKVKLM